MSDETYIKLAFLVAGVCSLAPFAVAIYRALRTPKPEPEPPPRVRLGRLYASSGNCLEADLIGEVHEQPIVGRPFTIGNLVTGTVLFVYTKFSEPVWTFRTGHYTYVFSWDPKVLIEIIEAPTGRWV